MMFGKKINKAILVTIITCNQLNWFNFRSKKSADMQKNIIEYFVRRPIPAAIAQHNSQKKDPFLKVIIKKKVDADQSSNNHASVVAN